VHDEAQRGVARHPAIGNLFGLAWLAVVELDIFEIVRAAGFKVELGGKPQRHLGECATLAVAGARTATAVLDDYDARTIAEREGIAVAGSLSLVARGVSTNVLDLAAASRLVDDLLGTEMRLPTDGATFPDWAKANGLL